LGCLLKRVFDIDMQHCANCGGQLKIIAAIVDPTLITKILTHLHLPARAPPRSPVRRLDLFQPPDRTLKLPCIRGLATSPGSRSARHSRKRQNGADRERFRR
jgi:hypothetical protein